MTFAGSPEQSRAEGRQSNTAMQSPRSLLPAPYSYCTRSLFGTTAIAGVAQTFPSASRLLPPESSHFLLQPARTSSIGGAARPFSIPTTRSPWSLVFGPDAATATHPESITRPRQVSARHLTGPISAPRRTADSQRLRDTPAQRQDNNKARLAHLDFDDPTPVTSVCTLPTARRHGHSSTLGPPTGPARLDSARRP